MTRDFNGRQAGNRICGAARAFLADERGATVIEYAMIAGGIAVAIAAVVSDVGTAVNGLFTQVKTSL